MPALVRRRRSAYEGPACPDCRRLLLAAHAVSGPQICPFCRERFEATAFSPPHGPVAESGPGGSVACARHERNAAVATCGRCGLFICSLCRISADGKILCPPCFDRMTAEGTLESTRTSFRDYGGSARMACIVGFFFWPLMAVFGAATLFYAIQGLKLKKELKEADGIVGLYIVLGLGILEFVGGGLLLAALFGAFR
jgi:hypothetical protein